MNRHLDAKLDSVLREQGKLMDGLAFVSGMIMENEQNRVLSSLSAMNIDLSSPTSAATSPAATSIAAVSPSAAISASAVKVLASAPAVAQDRLLQQLMELLNEHKSKHDGEFSAC